MVRRLLRCVGKRASTSLRYGSLGPCQASPRAIVARSTITMRKGLPHDFASRARPRFQGWSRVSLPFTMDLGRDAAGGEAEAAPERRSLVRALSLPSGDRQIDAVDGLHRPTGGVVVDVEVANVEHATSVHITLRSMRTPGPALLLGRQRHHGRLVASESVKRDSCTITRLSGQCAS